jgi:hypothetical protein
MDSLCYSVSACGDGCLIKLGHFGKNVLFLLQTILLFDILLVARYWFAVRRNTKKLFEQGDMNITWIAETYPVWYLSIGIV